VHYALPKGIVTATLNVYPDSARFEVTIDEKPNSCPIRSCATSCAIVRCNYEDEVTVTVNDKTFVSLINVKTTDKTGEIIVNVARALGALTGSLGRATRQQRHRPN
jgi:hypothetical protein